MQLPRIPISDTRDKKCCETTFILFFQRVAVFFQEVNVGCVSHLKASCGQVLIEIYRVRLHNVTHYLVNADIYRAAGEGFLEECSVLNGRDNGDAKITSGTIIEMNITGTLAPTGNLMPNLKTSPSLFTHAKSAQSVNHDINTRNVTTRSNYIHFNGYNTYLLFLII